MKRQRKDEEALKHPCRRCHAKEGEPCKNYRGQRKEMCKERGTPELPQEKTLFDEQK